MELEACGGLLLLTVRAGRGAAVSVVTKGVDVHATLSVGVLTADIPGDGGRGGLGILLEGDGARHLGVTTDDGNWKGDASVSTQGSYTSIACLRSSYRVLQANVVP